MAVDRAQLESEIEQITAQLHDERLAAFDPDTLRWLALPPAWTDSLAEACGFPASNGSLDETVDRARAVRLCETYRNHDIDGTIQLHFWMPNPTRESLLERLHQEDGQLMRATTREIAEAVLAAIDQGEEASSGMTYWARLAARELAPEAVPGETLTQDVAEALAAGDTARALEWIYAGDELAKSLGAEMQIAVTRARRHVNLHHRALENARDLARFVERDEQMRAIEDLLASDEEWAAHFIGPSGVGKTVFLRYLTALPPAWRGGAASLIDFDHIDPRYPLERPARLLEQLAHGLEDRVEDAAQESLLRSFRDAVVEADRLGAGPDPLATAQFGRVVASFAAFVSELPQPVLLILDTCEELAKLHPAGEDVPSIGATFDIIERVHEAAPSVRVIFAGRRWLTPAASNMTRGDATPGSVMSLEPRDYLRMHEIRGFSRAETVRYLTEKHGLALSDETIDAVLARSPDPGRAPGFDDSSDDEPRYSPLDLETFGDWLTRDRELSIETIASGDFSGYVEKRILDRLRDSPEVVAALPAAVELERFDSRAIQPSLGTDPSTRSAALAGLLEQEWTHLAGGPEPDDIVLEIDAGLLSRLRNYYAADPERRAELDAARATLRPHLAQLLEDSQPASLSVDVVDAALRILDPVEAVERFDRLADRVARCGAWSWAEAVCGRLLPEERGARLHDKLRPSVRALYVSALAQRGTSVDLGPLWEKVAEEAPLHPDLEQWAILLARGRLGMVRAQATRGEIDQKAVEDAYSIARPLLARPNAVPVLVPALVATIEALVDLAELKGVDTPPTLVQGCIEWLDERFESAATRAYVLTLAGRLQATREDWDSAREIFARVEAMEFDDTVDERHSADWVAPASRAHRALLEVLRFRLADRSEDGELIRRCEAAACGHQAVDAAQLLSLTLQARLASGDLTAPVVDAALEHEETVAGYRLQAPAHHVAPPLFVSIADCLMALGRADDALELLARRERLANASRSDDDAVRAAVLGSLGIMRRLRLRDRLALVSALSSSPDDALRTEALAAGALIVGLQPALGRATDYDHAAWRARILLDADGSEEALRRPLARRDPPDDSPVETIHTELDRLEAKMIRWRAANRRTDDDAVGDARRLADTYAEPRSIQDPFATQSLRIALRRHALLDEQAPVCDGRDRLLAQLAFDEGELLALRLPLQAAKLLRLAESLFAATGDEQGAFCACLRGAIADVHAGDAERARAARATVLRRYELVRNDDPALPERPSRTGAAPGALPEQMFSPMRAWLRRLDAYLRWCETPDTTEVRGVSTLALEPELALKPITDPKGLATPTRRARFRRYGSATVTLAAPLAAAFGVAAAISDAATGLGLVALIIAAALVAELIASVLPRLVLPIKSYDVSIAPKRQAQLGHRAEAELWLAPHARSIFVRLYLHLLWTTRPQRWAGVMPILDDPAGGRLPRSTGRAVRPRVSHGFLPLRLIVTPDLAPFGWERRLMSRTVLQRGVVRGEWPRIWRVRPEGLFRRTPERLPEPLVAVCAPGWQPFAERASNGALRPLALSRTPPAEAGAETSGARAVVALGSPLVTRAGWRLQIGEDPGADLAEGDQLTLQSPDRLVREAPIVVVMGQPGGRRATIQRSTSDGLRGFANEVFLAGAHAVISIPVLPSTTAAAVLGELTRQIGELDAMPASDRLLSLVDELRALIHAGVDVDGKTEAQRLRPIELALDICLFAPR